MSLAYEPEDAPELDRSLDKAPRPPFPIYTVTLIAAIVVVALIQMTTGLDRSILLAGFVKPAFRSGEYWRILTGAALHGGLIHLAFNSYAFYSFGKIFEMLSARAHLAIVFLLACVGGGVLSFVLSPGGISVGASGGIVGLIGYLAVYAFKRKDFITPEFRRSLLVNIGFILLYGLAMWQTVDNFGHIGGLLTGAAYAFVEVPTDPYSDPRETSGAVESIGLAALGLYLLACLYSVLIMFDLV